MYSESAYTLEAEKHGPGDSENLAMKNILLVDDEELVTKSVEKILIKQGHKVFACNKGKEAVEIAKSQQLDLIICDIRMPDMSGIETIKKIREVFHSKSQKPIPEILITGYVEDQVNQEVEHLNVAECIYKPFDLRDFLDCVKKNIGV